MNPLVINYDRINVPGIMAAKLWIKGGSGRDPKGKKGIHQLLGSLLSRGCGPLNNIDLANLVEGSGATIRCETYEDGILIGLKSSSKDFDKLIPILGWMVNRPHFDVKQLDLEKELSIQALKRQNESPFLVTYDKWRKAAYQNGPYAYDPLGIESDIKTVEREDLVKLSKSTKEKEKFLILAGDIGKKQIEIIKEFESFNDFTFSPANKNLGENIINYNKRGKEYSSINLTAEIINTEQVVLILGQTTLPHFVNEDLVLRLICCHLGCGMSSLLFRKLREEHGVAYEVGAHHPARELEAPFLIHASTSEEKALKTLKLLYQTWSELSHVNLSEEELRLMRSKFVGQIAHNSQTAGQRAERIAQLESLNLPVNHDQNSIEKIKNIGEEEIRNAASLYLSNPILSLCGPEKTVNKLINYWQNK